MNTKFFFRAVVAFIFSAVVSSCSPILIKIASYDMDDMYAPHDKTKIEVQKSAKAAVAAQRQEQNRAMWSEILGIPMTTTATATNTAAIDYAAIVQSESEMYNTPYGERLLALASDSYQRPSSYYMYNDLLDELSNYDPTQYTATFDANGNVIINPIYTSAIYVSWDVRPYYRDPWRYGYNPHWNRNYYRYGYYSSWHYDSYYYYNSFYWGYNPHYMHHYYRPRPYYYHYNNHHHTYKPSPNRPSNKPYTSTYKKAIVKQSSVGSSTSVGTRQTNGSTVGTQSKTTYNRGASSSTTTNTTTRTTNTTTKSSSSPTTSSGSTTNSSSSGSTNSIGR